MQKIKNLIHKDNATATGSSTLARDPIVHDHGTTIPNTIIPSGPVASTSTSTTTTLSNDRNLNGIPDNLEGARRNPLDRNGDGKVDLKDLSSNTVVPPGVTAYNTGAVHTNDRNMNGIPDNLETNFSGSSYATTDSSYLRSEPTIIQRVEKDVVVHEHIHPVEKEEIQPVIYRDREQMEIKQITQQLHETQIQPTLIQTRELPAETRAPIVERGAPIQENVILPTVDRDATYRTVQVNEPIVNETIKRTIIEEVQPVLERDVFVPTIVQQTQPIYEKVVEAPTVYRETLPVRELGTTNYVAEPIIAPVVREVPQQQLITPVTVVTTTTTTDSFVPAKIVAAELKNMKNNVAPTGRKVL